MSTKKVLVIDDEDFIRELVRDFLDLKDIRCDDAENAEIAVGKFSKNTYDLVLLDVNLGKDSAEEIITELKKVRNDIPIVLLTGDLGYDNEYSVKIGANGVIFKPFQVDDFITSISKLLES
jgi:DNA-binding NtrC family response regulator